MSSIGSVIKKKNDPQDVFNKTNTKIDLSKKGEGSVEDAFKADEKVINNLIEETANKCLAGQFQEALEKAKDAAAKEKTLRK